MRSLADLFSGRNESFSSGGKGEIFDISPEFDLPLFTGPGGYDKSRAKVKEYIGINKDVLLRDFVLSGGQRAFIVFVDGMCEKELIEDGIIGASRRYADRSPENKFSPEDDIIQLFCTSELSRVKSLSKGYIAALSGDALLVVEGESECFIMGVRAIESRSIQESMNEGSIRAPHEAFNENYRTNVALLRRRITDPNLTVEVLEVGRRSHTTIGLCYILGLTNDKLLSEVRKRIQAVDIDLLGAAGMLEQLIEGSFLSPLPQLQGTELPDTAAGALCNGRIVVLVNGSPLSLVIPASISDLMSASEDKYQRWSHTLLVKTIRWISLFIAVFASATYIAIISYHPGVLPYKMLLLTALNRVNVPFSSVLEVLLLEFALEMLREASTRMPSKIGSALSIVGGIIIGDATIQAGLVSPLPIIVVGIATLSTFAIPSYSLSSGLRIMKYFLILCSSIFGLLGLAAGGVVVLSRLVITDSFTLPFTTPFAPLSLRDAAVALYEMPAKLKRLRPSGARPKDKVKMNNSSEVTDS